MQEETKSKIKGCLWIFFFVYIFAWGLGGCNTAQAEITKKHINLNGNFNLGDTKKDSTLNLSGTKFKIHVSNEAYKNAKKNNFSWLDYGFNLVNKEDGHPVRFGDTSQRFELHIDDCGALYKKGKYRDCERKYKYHRLEAGTNDESWDYLFGHGDKRWFTFSLYLPADWKPTRATHTFFQFHSDKGPYPPVMYFKANKSNGFTVQIMTQDGMYDDRSGDACDGGVTFDEGSICNNSALKYQIEKFYQIDDLLAGKWNDFVIYSHFNQTDKGEMRIWLNGKQIVQYNGKTLFPNYKGKKVHATISYGIYEKIQEEENHKTWDELRQLPSVHYYDEIWVKNKCKKLDLERLGYSCSALLDQTYSIVPKKVKE